MYILVAYHYDTNLIKVIPIKNRCSQVITETWESLYEDFKIVGVAPKTYVLDNEKSKDLIDSFIEEKVEY